MHLQIINVCKCHHDIRCDRTLAISEAPTLSLLQRRLILKGKVATVAGVLAKRQRVVSMRCATLAPASASCCFISRRSKGLSKLIKRCHSAVCATVMFLAIMMSQLSGTDPSPIQSHHSSHAVVSIDIY